MDKNASIVIAANFCLLFLFFSLLTDRSGRPQVMGLSEQRNEAVAVSAAIGSDQFTLFGYTSPQALVTIQGMGIYDQAYADSDGYFELTNSFSPLSTREACLTGQDQFGRLTAPVCLPPFPPNRAVTVGPILMPPTVSLDKADYYTGDEVILSGQSIPETEITLSTFTKQSVQAQAGPIASSFTPIKPVEAATIPQLTIKTDAKGNYSVALPSAASQHWRLFTQTNFLKQASPQSIALNLQILPVWMIIIKFFGWIFFLIKPRLLEIAIIVQMLGLTLYLIKCLSHQTRKLAIVKREKFALIAPV